MKRLYPLFLVLVSLTSAVFFTTVTAVTLASYSKSEKVAIDIKDHAGAEGSTAAR